MHDLHGIVVTPYTRIGTDIESYYELLLVVHNLLVVDFVANLMYDEIMPREAGYTRRHDRDVADAVAVIGHRLERFVTITGLVDDVVDADALWEYVTDGGKVLAVDGGHIVIGRRTFAVALRYHVQEQHIPMVKSYVKSQAVWRGAKFNELRIPRSLAPPRT